MQQAQTVPDFLVPASLQDVPRADAVPGPKPEGDVPERAAPGAGVHGGRAAAVAGLRSYRSAEQQVPSGRLDAGCCAQLRKPNRQPIAEAQQEKLERASPGTESSR
jgi:hypothetical protein